MLTTSQLRRAARQKTQCPVDTQDADGVSGYSRECLLRWTSFLTDLSKSESSFWVQLNFSYSAIALASAVVRFIEPKFSKT